MGHETPSVKGGSQSWRDAVYTHGQVSATAFESSRAEYCVLHRSLPVRKSACSLGVRLIESIARVPLSLFRCVFPLIPFSPIAAFPDTRRYCIVSFCAECEKRRVSLSGERYPLLTAEYVILINGFPVFRQ